MSTPFTREQQVFFEELQSFQIPDAIAAIIVLKTNWQEIISWDESKELWRLATLIWETGLLETSPSAMRMAKKIRNKGLDTIYTLPKKKQRKLQSTEDGTVETVIPNFTVQELAAMGEEELTQLWWKVREVLDARDPDKLTDDEKNYLIMAIFYTTGEPE